MDTPFSMNLGGLDPAQHVAEDLALPILPSLGAVTLCKLALDTAATLRRGVMVVGPKGVGKTVGLHLAYEWFAALEREKRQLDNAHRPRRVLRVHGLRNTSYRDTALLLARKLSKTYDDRVRGRKKEPNEVRADFLQLCLKQNYAVLILDEAENCSDAALLLLRDLMADAEEEDPTRYRMAGATTAAGLGIVVAGDRPIEERLGLTNEASERWVNVIRVDLLTPEDVIGVYSTWFPGFTPHIESIGPDVWANYLSSVVCRGQHVSFRLLENHARMYVHYTARSNAEVRALHDVAFDADLFQFTLEQAAWALTIQHAPSDVGPVGGRRRGARAGAR
jgi:hypothetical protein